MAGRGRILRSSKHKVKGVYNVIIYIRLSDDDKDKEKSDESNSITNQRIFLKDWVESHKNKDGINDMILAEIIFDDGKTGMNFDREGILRLDKYIKDGDADCVVVKDLSRYGREMDLVKGRLKSYKNEGIRFIAVRDDFDSSVDDIDFFVNAKLMFNQHYSDAISTNVAYTMNLLQNEGKFIGAFATYGYKKDPLDKHHLVIDDYPASVIKRIFELYVNGTGKRTIATLLNDEKVLSPTAYKQSKGENYRNSKSDRAQLWSYASINNILKKQMYIGDMVQGMTERDGARAKPTLVESENWIVVEGTHKGIIDKVMWKKAQLLCVNIKRNSEKKHSNIFQGFIFCGDCNFSMNLVPNNSENLYLKCSGHQKYSGSCSTHSILYENMHSIVLNDLNGVLNTVKDFDNIVKKYGTNKKANLIEGLAFEIQSAERDIEKLKRRKDTICDSYFNKIEDNEDGFSNVNLKSLEEEMSRQLARCDESICKTQERNEVLIKQLKEHKKTEDYSPWIQRLLQIKKVEKLNRGIIAELIERIEIFDDKHIEITYNFKSELDYLFSIPNDSVA